MATDQWSCDPFDVEKGIFRYPIREKLGKLKWKGSYSCPSNAYAALCEYMDAEDLSKHLKDELIDTFSSSLVRTPERADEAFTVKKSPTYMTLVRYGGQFSASQFNEMIELDRQRQLFTQRIPNEVDDETHEKKTGLMYSLFLPSVETDPTKGPSWKLSRISPEVDFK